jgi:hypothetical protein
MQYCSLHAKRKRNRRILASHALCATYKYECKRVFEAFNSRLASESDHLLEEYSFCIEMKAYERFDAYNDAVV